MHAAGFEVLCKHIIKAVGELAQAKRLAFKLHAARFDTGHIQNIVDERKQVVGKLVDFLKILHRGVIFFKLALCQRKHADDAVHRRADLMRHAGKERGFRLVGFLRLHQALFIALYAAVHFSRFVKSEKVVSFCAALHNVHSDPLAVLHAEFCGHRFFSVPREIVPPNVATAFAVVQARLKARNVLLQTCERNAKQTFDIAHLVDRHFV